MKEESMLARKWKKILMLILIISCIINVMNKVINKISLDKEMSYSATYMLQEENTAETE